MKYMLLRKFMAHHFILEMLGVSDNAQPFERTRWNPYGDYLRFSRVEPDIDDLRALLSPEVAVIDSAEHFVLVFKSDEVWVKYKLFDKLESAIA